MEPEKRANKSEDERQSLITEYLQKQEQIEHIERPNLSDNEDNEDIELHKKTYELSRKKWELKEEQELLGIKESEVKYDEMELDNLSRKNRLRLCRRNREKMEKELKDLYVEQLNLDRDIDGVDEEEKIIEEVTLKTKIESLEYVIEEMKEKEKALKILIDNTEAGILQGRAKVEKGKKDLMNAKRYREKEMKEEEEGKWPGEPRWLIFSC